MNKDKVSSNSGASRRSLDPKKAAPTRTKSDKTSKNSRNLQDKIYLSIVEGKLNQLEHFTPEQIMTAQLTNVHNVTFLRTRLI